jgi:hypothetical protein
MNRTPPTAVRCELRREVGFGCPAPGCSNPYLEWHHFDPPWKVEEHHRPDGMIAPCEEHHTKADNGAYTVDQLRRMKAEAAKSRTDVQGRFDWLRRKLLVVVGGQLHPLAQTVLRVKGTPIIWFTRDDEQHVLVNIDLSSVSKSGEDRLVLIGNDWLLKGTPSDFHCPTSGRLIHAKYPGGDELRIEFFDVKDQNDLVRRYPAAAPLPYPDPLAQLYPDVAATLQVTSPITVVDVVVDLPGTPFSFGRKVTKVGPATFEDCVMYTECAFAWD